MKKMYLIDYWVPFPSSEYGGLVAVVAETDEECYDLLSADKDEIDFEYNSLLRKSIKNAQVFNLVEPGPSRIVEQFVT